MMAKEYHFAPTKYMVIDLTVVETTSVLKVTSSSQEAILWGKIYQARGRKVTSREIAGRNLSCLDTLSLQYLFWNVCQVPPPEDYSELIQVCLEAVNKLEVAETPVAALETELEALAPSESYIGGKSAQKPAKDPNAPAGRPKATTTTGIVWAICDELFVAAGNQLPDRKAVIAKCEFEEINPATASTQYSKWKKAKEVESI